MYVPDNYAQWERKEARLERALARRPVCCYCTEPIQDDSCYEINDELICGGCLNTHFKKDTEDYMA